MADNNIVEFIECTSLNLSYNIMGIVTITYTVVSNEIGLKAYEVIEAGGKTFTGYVVSASGNRIPETSSWYETHITLISTTN
jgi:hypothetical protein